MTSTKSEDVMDKAHTQTVTEKLLSALDKVVNISYDLEIMVNNVGITFFGESPQHQGKEAEISSPEASGFEGKALTLLELVEERSLKAIKLLNKL